MLPVKVAFRVALSVGWLVFMMPSGRGVGWLASRHHVKKVRQNIGCDFRQLAVQVKDWSEVGR